MAFSKYKEIGQVQLEFGISLLEQSFIPEEVVAPSEAFRSEFEFTLNSFPIISEGARTETIIFPVLREVYKDYHHSFTLWIEKPLSFNAQLSGTPDYILAAKSPLGKTVFTKPLVAMVEAKKNDFDYGWGQCLAELVAAQKINGDETFPVIGIVTDGESWQFGKLENSVFTKNLLSYPLGDLPRLFGALHYVFRTMQAAISTSPSRP
jgi:hypothetical protein